MIKKGIFGGTFDPIHNGHLYIAHKAIEKLNLDYIIFIPSGNPPHKTQKKKTEASIRYGLVNAAIEGEKKFLISDFEINNKELSYTYKTLEYFNNLEPNTEWYFISGADCLIELGSWKNVDKILSLCKLTVFNRPGYSKESILMQKERVEKRYNKEIVFLDINPLNISSTGIKEMIKEGKSVKHLLPERVYNIILKLKLYQGVNNACGAKIR